MIFNSGVWPTMIAAFTEDNKIDVDANSMIARRFIDQGTNGIFAVCQSSEMFFLSTEEKVMLAKTVVEEVAGEVNVLVSGHTSDSIDDQIAELKEMAKTGADGIVLVTNRLDIEEKGTENFKKNLISILDAIPDVDFGLYECPYPKLRLLTDEEVKWCASLDRIKFLKDVSCNADIQSRRVELVKGTSLKLFNANTQTLLTSLQKGYDGYNGIMGNFHIDIYKWLYENYKAEPKKAEKLQEWLTETCAIEGKAYPANVKFYLAEDGKDICCHMRVKPNSNLDEEEKQKVYDLKKKEVEIKEYLGMK